MNYKVLFVGSLMLLALSLLLSSRNIPVIPPHNPLSYVAAGSRTLSTTHSWHATEYTEMLETLKIEAQRTGMQYWQDTFSVGINGKLYPKHSIFSVVLGAFFYSLFGESGFWICQQLISLVLIYALFVVTKRFVPETSLRVFFAAILFACPNLLWGYTYQFAYDLHFAAMLILGCALVERYPFWGGLMGSFSIFIRPVAPLFLPILFFASKERISNQSKIRCLTGIGVSCIVFGALNWIWFGNPWTTSYQRLFDVSASGELIKSTHPLSPNVSVFISNWSDKLFDFNDGLFPLNLGLGISLLMLLRIGYIKWSHPVIRLVFLSWIPVIYFLGYPIWQHCQSSRFYMTSALCCVPALCWYWYAYMRGKEKT